MKIFTIILSIAIIAISVGCKQKFAINTKPSGAKVTNLVSKKNLGKTPITIEYEKGKNKEYKLNIELEGYVPKLINIKIDEKSIPKDMIISLSTYLELRTKKEYFHNTKWRLYTEEPFYAGFYKFDKKGYLALIHHGYAYPPTYSWKIEKKQLIITRHPHHVDRMERGSKNTKEYYDLHNNKEDVFLGKEVTPGFPNGKVRIVRIK